MTLRGHAPGRTEDCEKSSVASGGERADALSNVVGTSLLLARWSAWISK